MMNIKPIRCHVPQAVLRSIPLARRAINGLGPDYAMKFALPNGDQLNQSGNDGPLEILVMGAVGIDELSAREVVSRLSENADRDVSVRINSPGGLAFDGITIFNALASHKGKVTTTIEGLAGSAAGLIAMAGNPAKIMQSGSLHMHRALAFTLGNRIVHEDTVEFLNVIDDAILSIFEARTGMNKDKLEELLTGKVDGTVMGAREAKRLGFVDEIVNPKRKKPAANTTQCVPGNPYKGDGAAVGGEWAEPSLSDFTDDDWPELGTNTRASIARSFALVPADLANAQFDDLRFPHHFPQNHPEAGKPSINGVRSALSRLDSADISDDDRARVEAHLQDHLHGDFCCPEIDARMFDLELDLASSARAPCWE